MADSGPSSSFLHDLLKQSFDENASRTALVLNGTALTYGELHARAEGVAEFVATHIQPDGVVGIWAAPESAAYIAILGTWLAGRGYVPLHPDWPVDRLKDILAQTDVTTVFYGNGLTSEASETLTNFGVLPVSVDSLSRADGDAPAAQIVNLKDLRFVGLRPRGQQIAYILFTSGTTGVPKGVPISFGNIGAFLAAFLRLEFELTATDRWLQMGDLTFDLSILSFLPAWVTGGAVYPVSGQNIKYLEVLQLVQEHRLTVVPVVPSVLALWQPYFAELKLTDVRLLFACAEPFSHQLATQCSPAFPKAAIYNFYGPTEAAILATTHRWKANQPISKATALVPIGKPVSGMKLLRYNKHTGTAAPNGEILLAGPQVFSGYLDLETRFESVQNEQWYATGDIAFLLDGENVFDYRIDRQVQIGGHRIELEEVEQLAEKVLQQPVIVCAFREPVFEQLCIGLLFHGTADREAIIGKTLREALPPYMMPSRIIGLPEWPEKAVFAEGSQQMEDYFRHPADYLLPDNKRLELVVNNCFSLYRLLQTEAETALPFDVAQARESSWPNFVFDQAPRAFQLAERIEIMTAAVKAGKAPRYWWLVPDLAASETAALLMEAGWMPVAEYPCLTMLLTDFEPEQIGNGLIISRVRNDSELKTWLHIAGSGFGPLDSKQFEKTLSQSNTEYFVGYLNGEPVATSMLFSSDNIAGIHHVNVLEKHRKNGFGRAVFAHALNRAKHNGDTMAIAQSTDMGLPVWRSLGMTSCGKMQLFWMPGADKSAYFAPHGESGTTG